MEGQGAAKRARLGSGEEGANANMSFEELHPSGLVPQVQNVSASAEVGCDLDLRHVARRGKNVEYAPEKFPAVIIRTRNPRATTFLFSNGKMTTKGAKSVVEVNHTQRKVARRLLKMGFPVKFKNHMVDNLLASVNLGARVNLEKLAVKQHPRFAEPPTYEPEIFPACSLKVKDPQVSVDVYSTGKVLIKGGKSVRAVYEAFEVCFPLCMQCCRI